jgi:hypothetical protein
MSDASAGPAELVLRLDVHNERAVARLRLAGAIACAIGALTIASLGPTLIGWVVVGAAGLASVGWTAAYFAARRRTAVPATYSLALRADALELCEAGQTVTIPWSAIRAAEVDEDRLVVLVHPRDAEKPVVLEPRYEGLSVYALRDLIAERLAPAPTQARAKP